MVEEQVSQFTDDLGRSVEVKLKTYASFHKADQEKVFEWLREIERDDAIKTNVNKRTLSSIIQKRMEDTGEEIPSFIDIFQPPRITIKQKNKSLRRKHKEERKDDDDE